MYVLNERFSIMKNGRRTGNFALPHNVVCYSTCEVPLLLQAGVRKPMQKLLLASSESMW